MYRMIGDDPFFLLIRDSYQNWGFPKGHIEREEQAAAAALREVMEETGLHDVALDGPIDTIDWFFRFKGRPVHKVCHFFLMRTDSEQTTPQLAEGITECQWLSYEDAVAALSYANARDVLGHAYAMIRGIDLSRDPAANPVVRS